jgi:WD40 repeat protein
LSPDGATLATATDEGIQFWDVATASKGPGAQPIAEIILKSSGVRRTYELAPSHKVFIVWDYDGRYFQSPTGTVKLWRIRSAPGEALSVIPYGELTPDAFSRSQSISPNSKMVAIQTYRARSPTSFWNRVKAYLPWLDIDRDTSESVLLDLESGERVAVLPDCGIGKFSPDSRSFAAQGYDNKIHLWDIPPRKPMWIVLTVATVAGIMTWLVRRWFLRASRRRTT